MNTRIGDSPADQPQQRAQVHGVHVFTVALFFFRLQVHRAIDKPLVIHQVAERL